MIKYIFDRLFSFIGIIFLLPVYIIVAIVIFISMGLPVFFVQKRVGQKGRIFTMYKFRTMRPNVENNTISIKGDSRITPVGAFLRRFKLDELPELINVLIGDMSFVGPRPDVPGYADTLEGDQRRVLLLKPGITGPATLKYSNEEEILSKVDNPREYNDTVIFPDKVRINLEYYNNATIFTDIKIIWQTIYRKNY